MADGAPEPDTKELLREGFAAFKKNDWEAARAAFTAAWNVRRHFAVAFSLAEVEMRLGHYVEAAQYWQYVLNHIPDDLTDQREQAARQLEACLPHVGTVTVQVNGPGATIYVDGAAMGESPLGRELYVQPGDHELYAEKGGRRSPIRFFRISAKSRLSFALELPEPPSAPQASAQNGASPVAVASSADRPAPAAPSSLRTPVLVTGLVASVAAAATGTVFVLKSNGAADDARAAFDQAVTQSDPSIDPNTVCGRPGKPVACDTAATRLADRDRFRNIAIGSFVASGVLAAGTAAAYWFWPRPSGAAEVVVHAAPVAVDQRGIALGLAGRF